MLVDNPQLSFAPPPNAFEFPDNEKDRKDWFEKNIRWVISHWNRKNYFPGEDQSSVLNPVEKMEKFFRYYMGRQGNKDYNWSVLAKDNTPLPVVWISGQKIGDLVNHLDKTGKQIIRQMKVTVKAVSKQSQNERTRLWDSIQTKMMLRQDFEEFEKIAGVGYNPIGKKDKEFATLAEAERWMNKDYRERSAEFGQKIGMDVYRRNHYTEICPESLRHVWITGLTAMHNYVYNGRVITELIEPMQLIWDNAKGYDQFNRQARFAGFIEYLEPSDVMQRYGKQLDTEAKDQIKKLTTENAPEILPLYSLVRGHISSPYGVKISKATVYWRGKRNLGWKAATESQWGHEPHYKVDKSKGEKGDYEDQCVYQGTLLGNRWLVDCGVAPNQVKDLYNPGWSDLPIKVFAPNLTMGETNSIVSRLHQLQDLVDYYTNEIKKVVARNVGMGHVFFADQFDGVNTPEEFISDLQQTGIHFMTKKHGMANDSRTREDLYQQIDMTLDVNVDKLMMLRAEQERIMESIAGLSPVALGQQSQYVSQGVQQSTINQSSVYTSAVIEDFAHFVEIVLANATNMGKIIHTLESGQEIPVVGDNGRDWLKETTEFSFEDLGVEIRILDIIDEQGRQEIERMAQAMATNGFLDFLDWIKVRKAETYTEAMEELTLSFQRKERKAEEQAKMQQAAQQLEAARQNQVARDANNAKLAQTQMVVSGKSQDTAMKVEADLIKTGYAGA